MQVYANFTVFREHLFIDFIGSVDVWEECPGQSASAGRLIPVLPFSYRLLSNQFLHVGQGNFVIVRGWCWVLTQPVLPVCRPTDFQLYFRVRCQPEKSDLPPLCSDTPDGLLVLLRADVIVGFLSNFSED